MRGEPFGYRNLADLLGKREHEGGRRQDAGFNMLCSSNLQGWLEIIRDPHFHNFSLDRGRAANEVYSAPNRALIIAARNLACDNNRLLLLASIQIYWKSIRFIPFWFKRRKCAAERILTLRPPIPVAPVTSIGTVVVRGTGGNLLALIGTDYAATGAWHCSDSGID
jgi:hypothetical protein